MSNEEQAPKQENADVASNGAETGQSETAGEELLLEDARAKADENWNLYLRSQAEMENLRRRAQKDLESAHKFGLERFASELLPVKDSLELGLAAVQESKDEAVAKLREGTELTLKMLGSALEKFGITEINPEGQPFNPEQHQAMTMLESAEAAPNTVMNVMQKGYLLNERVMRPALVVVSKAPAAKE